MLVLLFNHPEADGTGHLTERDESQLMSVKTQYSVI